jgi:hypothetical protein
MAQFALRFCRKSLVHAMGRFSPECEYSPTSVLEMGELKTNARNSENENWPPENPTYQVSMPYPIKK